jgi:hypothetical protein
VSAETELLDQLTAALGSAVEHGRTLAATIADLDLVVDQRAQALAHDRIAAAEAATAGRVAEADADQQRQRDLIAEMRRILGATERARDLALRERDQARAELDAIRESRADAHRLAVQQRTAAWKPTSYPSRPLTPEQEEAAALGHARTDWPTWVMPCDPIVSVAESTITVGCATTSGVIVQTGTCTWAKLVRSVATHRCMPAGEDGDR